MNRDGGREVSVALRTLRLISLSSTNKTRGRLERFEFMLGKWFSDLTGDSLLVKPATDSWAVGLPDGFETSISACILVCESRFISPSWLSLPEDGSSVFSLSMQKSRALAIA